MMRRFIYSVVAAAAFAALCLVPVHLAAQGAQATSTPTPRDAAGHPDLTGVWGGGGGGGDNPTDDTGNISVFLVGRVVAHRSTSSATIT